MTRIRNFWNLPWVEKGLFLQATWLLFKTERALKSRKFAAVRADYERRFLIRDSHSATLNPQRISELVKLANWHSHLRVSCLRESLALWGLLRQHGYAPYIRVGVTSPREGFAAHAWVELDSEILNDTVEVVSQYTVFEQ